MRILYEDYIKGNDGMLLSEIKEKLMISSQKKYVPRLVQKLVNKELIDSIPFWDGKWFFKKIRLSFKKMTPELVEELNKLRQKGQQEAPH